MVETCILCETNIWKMKLDPKPLFIPTTQHVKAKIYHEIWNNNVEIE